MPACNINREVIGSTAWYRIAGKFESSCAWDLSRRVAQEHLSELTLDFSQVGDFVDYGIAVLSSSLLEVPHKTVHLEGLRQHQMRLFRYFGVEPSALDHTDGISASMEDLPLPMLAHGIL